MRAVIAPQTLIHTFDRVVVINLDRRPERLRRFWENLHDWPFRTPERFAAFDGLTLSIPSAWDKGAGAWGCMLSHRAVLEKAIADDLSSLLVLEDDACPVDGFSERAAEFLNEAPVDWDALMLGAGHLQPPASVAPGAVRCTIANRCHAYAVRRNFMRVLAEFWRRTENDHCDIVLASLMTRFNVYAPDPLLIGQDAGDSDITGRRETLRFLAPADKLNIAARGAVRSIEGKVAVNRLPDLVPDRGPVPVPAHPENGPQC